MSNQENDWPHVEQALAEGSVTYVCKYEGIYDVSEPKGMKVVQEAFIQMRDKKKNRRAEGLKRAPLVDVEISIRGVKVIYQETLCIQMQVELAAISYIASDGANQRYLAFVSNKKDNSGFECTILKNENNKTKEIVKTLGQAFDLAFREKSNSISQENDTSSASTSSTNGAPYLPEPGDLTREELVEHLGVLRHRILDLTKWVAQDELRAYMKERQLLNITEVLNEKQRKERSSQVNVVVSEEPKIVTVTKASSPVGPSLLDLNQASEVTVAPPQPPSRAAAAAVTKPNDLFGMDVFQQPQQQANMSTFLSQPLAQQPIQQPTPLQHFVLQPAAQQPLPTQNFMQPQGQTQPMQHFMQPQAPTQPMQHFMQPQAPTQPMQNFMQPQAPTQPMQHFMQPQAQFMQPQFVQQTMQQPLNNASPLKPDRSPSNPFGANLMEIRSEIETIEFDPLKLG